MPFYLRKSIKAGPLRINLSKSGLGISAGIKGLRIGTGPRGHYIHAGRNGYYYRKTLNNKKSTSPVSSIPKSSSLAFEDQNTNILQLVESSESDLLEDIRKKLSAPNYKKIAYILGVLFLLYSLSQYQSNIIVAIILSIVGVLLFPLGNFLYANLQILALFYDMEEEAISKYEILVSSFEEVQQCKGMWKITSSASVNTLHDWKVNAGAGGIVNLVELNCLLSPHDFIKTNIPIPVFRSKDQWVCLFPDQILVIKGKSVASVKYSDAVPEVGQNNFIEERRVPSDATQVDLTWKYVNKNGSPDKRFKDNKRLPILQYTMIIFSNQKGLNEMYYFSKANMGDSFRNAIVNITHMSKQADSSSLRNIHALLEARKKKEAFQKLNVLLTENPNNIEAWLVAIEIVPKDKRHALLQMALAYHPDNSNLLELANN